MVDQGLDLYRNDITRGLIHRGCIGDGLGLLAFSLRQKTPGNLSIKEPQILSAGNRHNETNCPSVTVWSNSLVQAGHDPKPEEKMPDVFSQPK